MVGLGGRGALKNSEELRDLVLLRLLPGIGDRKAVRLLQAQGSAQAALALSSRAFSAAAGRKAEQARRDPKLIRRAEWIIERCDELGITMTGFGEDGYPRRLLALSDPPPVLFLRGDWALLSRTTVAVVGSRRATPVGRRTAERLARELSEVGITIVSGLALGVDGAAHRGALEGNGGTIAVLGSGPDRPHPSSHRSLFRRIVEMGLVVSEFPPGEPARTYHFPRRNRVLAALSRAVVVVEAAKKSGALITVDHALDLGLDIFAVPGCVEAAQAEGTNALLRDGAHLLCRGSELLEVMGWTGSTGGGMGGARRPRDASGIAEGSMAAVEKGGDPTLRIVADALGTTPRSLDELVEWTKIKPSRVLEIISRLELVGLVARRELGWIRRAASFGEMEE